LVRSWSRPITAQHTMCARRTKIRASVDGIVVGFVTPRLRQRDSRRLYILPARSASAGDELGHLARGRSTLHLCGSLHCTVFTRATPRNAVFAVATCPSVCPSVPPSLWVGALYPEGCRYRQTSSSAIIVFFLTPSADTHFLGEIREFLAPPMGV